MQCQLAVFYAAVDFGQFLPAVPQLGTTPPKKTAMWTYVLAAVPTLQCLPDSF